MLTFGYIFAGIFAGLALAFPVAGFIGAALEWITLMQFSVLFFMGAASLIGFMGAMLIIDNRA